MGKVCEFNVFDEFQLIAVQKILMKLHRMRIFKDAKLEIHKLSLSKILKLGNLNLNNQYNVPLEWTH